MKITSEQYKKLGNKKSKYGNKKTLVDGITFDSKKEADRYGELKLLERQGIIKDLELQPQFELMAKFKKNGKTHRAINYKADFKYINADTGKTVIEDVKGVETEVFKIKRKLFEKKYPELEISIVKGRGK